MVKYLTVSNFLKRNKNLLKLSPASGRHAPPAGLFIYKAK